MKKIFLFVFLAGATLWAVDKITTPTDFRTVSTGSRDGLASNFEEIETKFDASVDTLTQTRSRFSNWTTNFTITSTQDLIHKLDSDTNGTNRFVIFTGQSDTLMRITEDSTAKIFGSLDVTGAVSFADTITFSDTIRGTALNLSGLTASQAVFTDASKNLVSNAITGSGNVVMSVTPTFTDSVDMDSSLEVGKDLYFATNNSGLWMKGNAGVTCDVMELQDHLYFGDWNNCTDVDDILIYSGEGDNIILQDWTSTFADFSDANIILHNNTISGSANTYALGGTSNEWSDLYLGDGAVIYGQNDQSNTITSAVTGWTFNLPITTSSGIKSDDSITMGDDDFIGLGTGKGLIEFDDQATDEVNILNANVGINDATPSYRLDVNGTLRATGKTQFDDTLGVGASASGGLLHISKQNFSTTNVNNGVRITDTDASLSNPQTIGRIQFESRSSTDPGVIASIEVRSENPTPSRSNGNILFFTGDSASNLTQAMKINSNRSVEFANYIDVDTILSSTDTVRINDNLKVTGAISATSLSQDTISSTGDTVFVKDVLKVFGNAKITGVLTVESPMSSNTDTLFISDNLKVLNNNIYADSLATSGNERFVYDRDTFTVTTSGLNPEQAQTANYVLIGDQVTIHWPYIMGTSDATNFFLSGIPAAIRPANDVSFIIPVVNGVGKSGRMQFDGSAGTAFLATDTSGIFGSGSWYNSGKKGIGLDSAGTGEQYPVTTTYLINNL